MIEIILPIVSVIIVFVGGCFVGRARGRNEGYDRGYGHGLADSVPVAGTCGECGWEPEQRMSLQSTLEAIMMHHRRGECDGESLD